MWPFLAHADGERVISLSFSSYMALSFSSYKATSTIRLGPHSITSFHLNYLLKALSPDILTLGVKLQHMNSGGEEANGKGQFLLTSSEHLYLVLF